jgi:hypothetical protein
MKASLNHQKKKTKKLNLGVYLGVGNWIWQAEDDENCMAPTCMQLLEFQHVSIMAVSEPSMKGQGFVEDDCLPGTDPALSIAITLFS